jgi:hypothetical protein
VVTNEMCFSGRKQLDRKGAKGVAAARQCDRLDIPTLHSRARHSSSLAYNHRVYNPTVCKIPQTESFDPDCGEVKTADHTDGCTLG